VANAVLVPVQPEGHSNPLIAASKPLAFGVTTFAAELHVPTLSVNVNVILVAEFVNPAELVPLRLKVPKTSTLSPEVKNPAKVGEKPENVLSSVGTPIVGPRPPALKLMLNALTPPIKKVWPAAFVSDMKVTVAVVLLVRSMVTVAYGPAKPVIALLGVF
jgi:hypothetical protein